MPADPGAAQKTSVQRSAQRQRGDGGERAPPPQRGASPQRHQSCGRSHVRPQPPQVEPPRSARPRPPRPSSAKELKHKRVPDCQERPTIYEDLRFGNDDEDLEIQLSRLTSIYVCAPPAYADALGDNPAIPVLESRSRDAPLAAWSIADEPEAASRCISHVPDENRCGKDRPLPHAGSPLEPRRSTPPRRLRQPQ